MPTSPVASTANERIETAATRPAWPDTQSAMRCQAPVVVSSSVPARGMNGQNNFGPNSASSGGSTSSTKIAATTSPAAACTPRLLVVGDWASSRVSRAKTTVALLATIAGPAHRTAVRRAVLCAAGSRRSSSRYREISSSA